MDIYTSYYAKAKQLDDTKYLKVAISRRPPRDYIGTRCTLLAPSSALLSDYHKGLSQEEYTQRYREEIDTLPNLHRLFEQMAITAKGRDIVLLCYEKSDAFCHRHILADIILETYHYQIKEL